MRDGWKQVRLGDVVVENPKSKFKVRDSIRGGRFPFFTSGSNVTSSNDFICSGENLFVATGGRPLVQYFDGKASHSTDCWSMKTKPEMLAKFLFHFLESVLPEIDEEMFEGAALRHLQKARFRDVPVPCPPLLEQERIVGVLDEANQGVALARTNAQRNLQNARAIFEGQLNGEEARKVALGDLVRITTGRLDANAAVEGGRYPFFTCSREAYAIDEYAFDCEAILLAGNNAVGDFNVKHYRGRFNAYQRTYVITVNDQELVLYRYLYYQMLKGLKRFKQQSVGAGTKFLKLGIIRSLEISLPSPAEQERVASTLDCLRIHTELLESIYLRKLAALEELKKSLLHQAFSGQL